MGKKIVHAAWFFALAQASFGTACKGDDDDAKTAVDAGTEQPESDAAEDAPDDAGEPDCYEDASTHLQIINACTEAEKVAKDPALPLLLPDGGLPALP